LKNFITLTIVSASKIISIIYLKIDKFRNKIVIENNPSVDVRKLIMKELGNFSVKKL